MNRMIAAARMPSASLEEQGGVPYVVSIDSLYYGMIYYNNKVFAKAHITPPANHRFTSLAQMNGDVKKLSGAGFDASISDGIIARMWQKWVFIATIGALTSVMRGTVGDIVAVPGGRDLGPAILAEATAVASAAGYPVPGDAIAETARTVTQAGSAVDSSLSRDVAEGRPAEVEQVLADLASRGAGHGIKTPLLDLATMQLRVYNNSLHPPR